MNLKQRLESLSKTPPHPKFTTTNPINMNEKMLSAGPYMDTVKEQVELERIYSVCKKVEYSVQDQFGNTGWPRPQIMEKEDMAILQVGDNAFPLVPELTTEVILNFIKSSYKEYYDQQDRNRLLSNTELLLKTYRNEL